MPISAAITRTPTLPRAAAVAGVVFSLLMGVSLVIVRLAVPAYQTDATMWLNDPIRRTAVRFAIHLAPFAGIAFLWFLGVLRNRVGVLEDQFFATVFLGSGLLFVASLFASAAFSGALVEAATSGHIQALNSETYYLTGLLARSFLNVFAIKMAGVFIVSTCTIVLRTRILPRWVAFSGYACALVLLLVITNWQWIALLFPLWMLVLSVRVLLAELRPAVLDLPGAEGNPSSATCTLPVFRSVATQRKEIGRSSKLFRLE